MGVFRPAWIAVLPLVLVSARPLSAASLRPKDIRQNLFSACFINEYEGWVTGELGRVFHTTDGGKTFERLETNTKRAVLSIACFPDKTLVAVGQKGIGLRSKDGGKTWENLTTGTERNLISLTFATPQIAMAVGDFGTILRSEDGGTSWTVVPVPEDIPLPEEIAEVIVPGDVLLYDVHFPKPERGTIVGEFGVIFSTEDGGKSWVARESPVDTTLFGVYFADERNGWAVGIESAMLRTTDGGMTWETQDVPRRRGFVLSLYDVAVVGQFGWVIGDSGLLLRSSDGGETWQRAEVPIHLASNWLRGLSLTPDAKGFMIGEEGLVLTTERDQFHEM